MHISKKKSERTVCISVKKSDVQYASVENLMYNMDQ